MGGSLAWAGARNKRSSWGGVTMIRSHPQVRSQQSTRKRERKNWKRSGVKIPR